MASKFDVDEKLLRKLAGILNDTGLTEIEFEVEGQRVRVAKGASTVHMASPGMPFPGVAPAPAPAPAAAAPASSPESAPGTVKSPMVGTVYCSPEPGKAPFVKVGDEVKEGQTLLIIEAMKVMNALPSPRSGKVTQVLITDGQPVEYGEPLLVIE